MNLSKNYKIAQLRELGASVQTFQRLQSAFKTEEN